MLRPVSSSGSLVRKKAAGLESAATIRTKVFVWGLNDKDQLGGLKGSKVPGPELPRGAPHTGQPQRPPATLPCASQSKSDLVTVIMQIA